MASKLVLSGRALNGQQVGKESEGLSVGRRLIGHSSGKRTRKKEEGNQEGQDECNNFYMQQPRIIIANLMLKFPTT